jgi:hypothetical protein
MGVIGTTVDVEVPELETVLTCMSHEDIVDCGMLFTMRTSPRAVAGTSVGDAGDWPQVPGIPMLGEPEAT